jgi:hypothetical protein
LLADLSQVLPLESVQELVAPSLHPFLVPVPAQVLSFESAQEFVVPAPVQVLLAAAGQIF